jgi:biopolymer transport protein ExbB
VFVAALGWALPAGAQAPSAVAQLGSQAPAEPAQDAGGLLDQQPSFDRTRQQLEQDLTTALAELSQLREKIQTDLVGLGQQQSGLEQQVSAAKADLLAATRAYEQRSLELSTLVNEEKSLDSSVSYLSNLFGEYTNNFESRLLLPEMQRYGAALEAAKLAPSNSNLTQAEIFAAQVGLLGTSLDRIEESFGGLRFDGRAVDDRGLVLEGTYVLVGPLGVFTAKDGQSTGTAETRINSNEPALIAFQDPLDGDATRDLATRGEGYLVLDPTMGNARKVEDTEETLWEHIVAGGPVMVPIFMLAAAALLVALYKWIGFALLGNPSRRRVDELMDAVETGDNAAALERAKQIKGPMGRMLRAGAEHLGEPKELIEEAMFEKVLTTKLRLNSMLPFIGVSASSAPLLGLLGTVTGIINTFKMITVVGSGDVKTLSGGISEALITTEYGLIVAIPSLLIHAMLTRKAKGILSRMEVEAVNFLRMVAKAEDQAKSSAPKRNGALPAHAPASGHGLSDPQIEQLVQAKVREALASLAVGQGAGQG